MAKGNMPEGIKTTMYWALGIGIIAFILLMMVIIFGNLMGNVGFAQDTASYSNETITFNLSAIPASVVGKVNPSLSGIILTNASGGQTIPANNYTTSNGRIITAGASTYNSSSVNVSYTVAYDSQAQIDSDNLIINYTTSATNTGKQLPTVGTILGIALLLVILIGVLVFTIRKMMNVTGSSGLGTGKSSSKFKGSSNAEFG